MSSQQTSQVLETDARSLAQKLAEFSKTLTPGEQAALKQAIQGSMSQQGDVQGFANWDPGQESSWWAWWSSWSSES